MDPDTMWWLYAYLCHQMARFWPDLLYWIRR
jgi:hypothetical protein